MQTTKELVKYNKSHRRAYLDSKGNKLPGVTTVLGILNKPALLEWVYKLAQQGIDYKKVRDHAADVGTICHFMCECFLKNQEPDLSEFPKDQVALAFNGFHKFTNFWNESGFKVRYTELQIASEMLGYGGSLDTVCEDKDGNLVLLDIKTSKAIYPEYWAQVAAYTALWAENNTDKDKKFISRHMIIRVGKEESGDFEVVEEKDLRLYWMIFDGALTVYKAQKLLKK